MLSLSALLLLACVVRAQNDPGGNWPIEIPLAQADRPTGIVAGRDTYMFVSTVSGQLWRVDVKSGSASLINDGGDGQALAGLCTDERGRGTLYAAGRDSGKLFAFDYDGVLRVVYQITPPSTKARPHFVADCIHTRYRLLITDAYADMYYWLPLLDKGPRAGTPAPKDNSVGLQGFAVPMRGQWPKRKSGRFGAYAIEWTAKWNETAFMMHAASGSLFAFDIKSKSRTGATMRQVAILGRVKKFPGSVGLLFDSTNELVLYVMIPGQNAIAVLEMDYRNQYRAKFQRYLSGSLVDGPLMLGEYGDWIYPISGRFRLPQEERDEADYTLTRLSRHRQEISETKDTADPFTALYDESDLFKDPEPVEPEVIETKILSPPPSSDRKARGPEDSALPRQFLDPSPTPNTFKGYRIGEIRERNTRRCFPADAFVTMEDGSTRRMDALRLNDRVAVGRNADGTLRYSPIFLFSHSDSNANTLFVELTLADHRSLRLSPGHYAYASKPSGKVELLVPADEIEVNDTVDGSRVVSAIQIRDNGLYHPHTLDGAIVVNNVRVSTYTTAVPPAGAHSMLSALRPLLRCRQLWILRRVSNLLSKGGESHLLRMWRL